ESQPIVVANYRTEGLFAPTNRQDDKRRAPHILLPEEWLTDVELVQLRAHIYNFKDKKIDRVLALKASDGKTPSGLSKKKGRRQGPGVGDLQGQGGSRGFRGGMGAMGGSGGPGMGPGMPGMPGETGSGSGSPFNPAGTGTTTYTTEWVPISEEE